MKIYPLLCYTPRHEEMWRSGGILHAFWNTALDGFEWSASRSGRFTFGERSLGSHWIGSWVGFRAGLNALSGGIIPNTYRESNPNHPACSLAATSTPDVSVIYLNFYLYSVDYKGGNQINLDISMITHKIHRAEWRFW